MLPLKTRLLDDSEEIMKESAAQYVLITHTYAHTHGLQGKKKTTNKETSASNRLSEPQTSR